MLREIEAHNLMFFANPQSNCHIHNLQNNQRANNRQRPCNGDAHQLVEYLMKISLDHSGGQHVALSVLKNWVYGTRCENSRENCTESSTRSMNTEGIERVVVAEAGFHGYNHIKAKRTRDQANHQCRHGTYETGGRSDGY